jgi:hypothetical protein
VQLRPERRYFRQILQALSRSSFAADPLRAEIALSKVLGVVWAHSRDGDAEEAFGLGLAEYARQTPGPASVALLSALASVGTLREVREAAAAARDVLVASGVPGPGWPILVLGQCWAHEDAFGDLTTIVAEFGYERPSDHGLVVQVDHVSFSAAVDIRLVEDVPGLIQELQYGVERATHTLRQVEPGWAGAILGRAFARTDLIPTVVVSDGFAANRAVALSRVRSLPAAPDLLPIEPEPTEARRSAVVAEFLASITPWQPGADAVARLIVDFAAAHDPGELTRVSPGRWEVFLFEWLPRSLPAPPLVVADVVRAWSAWAAPHSGLSLAAREHLGRVLDEMLTEYLMSNERPEVTLRA